MDRFPRANSGKQVARGSAESNPLLVTPLRCAHRGRCHFSEGVGGRANLAHLARPPLLLRCKKRVASFSLLGEGPSRSLSDTSWPFGHPPGTARLDHPSSRDGGPSPQRQQGKPWSSWLPVNSSLVQLAPVDEIDGCRGSRVPRRNARKPIGVSDRSRLQTSACALRSR